MDIEYNADNTSDRCSIISGSSENSKHWYGVSSSIPMMKTSVDHLACEDLSPLIPMQDIVTNDTEISWKDNCKLEDDSCQKVMNSISKEKNINGIIPSHDVLSDAEFSKFVSSSCIENNMRIEKSKMKNFSPNSVEEFEGLNIAEHQTSVIEQTSIDGLQDNFDSAKFKQAIIKNDVATNQLSAHKNGISQPDDERDILSQDIFLRKSSSVVLEQRSQANVTLLEDSQVDLFESDNQSGQKLKTFGDHLTQQTILNFSSESPTPCKGDGQIICSSITTFCNSQPVVSESYKKEIMQLSDDYAVSEISSCTIRPNTTYYKNESSSLKFHEHSPQLELQPTLKVYKPKSWSLNKSCTFRSEDDLPCQEQNKDKSEERCDVSFSSQGTKTSSDLFLNSMNDSNLQNTTQDLLQTNKDIICSGTTNVQFDRNTVPNIDRQVKSSPSLQKIPNPKNPTSSVSKEPLSRFLAKKKLHEKSMVKKEICDASIHKDHEKKMSSLHRFDALCNQIVSRLDHTDDSLKDALDDESCLHRCEFLITKMHSMQNEEKIKLCTSLKCAGLGKQRKRMLKIQLELLKSRHKTLMGVVNKYGKIKNRIKNKGLSSKQKLLLSQDSTKSQKLLLTEKTDDVEKSNSQCKLQEHTQLYIDSKTDDNCNDHIRLPNSKVTCMEETQHTDKFSLFEDCVVISESSNEKDILVSQRKVKENITTSSKGKENIVTSLGRNSPEPKSSKESSKNQIQCGVNDDSTINKATKFNALNDIGNDASKDNGTFQNKKNVAHSNFEKSCIVTKNEIQIATVLDMSSSTESINKRKSTLKFYPPIKKKPACVKTVSIAPKKDVMRLLKEDPMRFNKRVNKAKQKSESQLRITTSNSINPNIISSINETYSFIDNVWFTEFQDPSFTNNVSLKLKGSNLQSTNNSSNETQGPISNMEIPCTLDNSNFNVDSTHSMIPGFKDSNHVGDSVSNFNGAFLSTELPTEITQINQIPSLTTGQCTSLTCSPENRITSKEVFARKKERLHLNKTNNSKLTHNQTSNTDAALVNTIVSSDSSHVEYGNGKKSLPLVRNINGIMKSNSTIPLNSTLFHADNAISIRQQNHITDLTLSPKLHVPSKEQSSLITSKKSVGPSSPCSTQGSSLFPVSSKEIVRRVQSRQSSQPRLVADTSENKYCLPKASFVKKEYKLLKESLAIPKINPLTISSLSNQYSQPLPNISTHFNLEPSSVSLNTIMTSSLCAPQIQTSKQNVKPRRSRKVKSKMESQSQFTQTSLERFNVMTIFEEKANDSTCNNGIRSSNAQFATTKKVESCSTNCEYLIHSRYEQPVFNMSSLAESQSCLFGRRNEKNSTNSSWNTFSIISNLRKIHLIADEELISSSKGFPADFWDEEFAQITMAKSVWSSVVEW